MNALQQKLPDITLLLLVVVMIAALTLQTYYFFTPAGNEPGNEMQAATQTSTQARTQRDINKYTLFGVPSKINAEQPIVQTDNLPKTNLRLILRGVSAPGSINGENLSGISDEDIIASALIEGPNKDTLKYTINDTLPGNAKLKSVYDNRIVIERNGRLENLYFPDSQSIGIVSSTSPAYSLSNSALSNSALSKPASSQTYAPQNFSKSATNLDTLSDQRKQEIKQRLQQLREKMKQSQ